MELFLQLVPAGRAGRAEGAIRHLPLELCLLDCGLGERRFASLGRVSPRPGSRPSRRGQPRRTRCARPRRPPTWTVQPCASFLEKLIHPLFGSFPIQVEQVLSQPAAGKVGFTDVVKIRCGCSCQAAKASEEDERLPLIQPLELEVRSELTACAYDRPDG
jgi:hypothetical protein